MNTDGHGFELKGLKEKSVNYLVLLICVDLCSSVAN
jgi:hypothetical protein